MTITLLRFANHPEVGTFGEVHVEGERFFTVERPWLDNQPFKSCVPSGVYDVVTLPTTTPVPDSFDGKTWYLKGDTVGIDKGRRTRIAIHIANTMDDLAGCIGFGLSLGVVKNKWAVLNSTSALVRLKQFLPEEFRLRIIGDDL